MGQLTDRRLSHSEEAELIKFLRNCGATGHPGIWPALARMVSSNGLQHIRDSMLSRLTAMKLRGGTPTDPVLRGAEYRLGLLNDILKARGEQP